MKTKPRPPILPSRPADPTGADALERSAMRAFRVRVRKARKAYVEAIDRFPREPSVNARYTYRLDPFLLQSVLRDTGAFVDSLLLEGGADNVWFFEAFVELAYRRGTAQQFSNLARQSSAYRGGQESLARVLRSEPYRRRLALIAAREFEEMKGLSGDVQANMARVLTDGLARGQNPLVIARRLSAQAGIEERRANRIARTEITTALRRARLDEAEDAQEEYGLRSLEMHFSALSPTTRATHAARHGKLYTVEQQRDWWAQDANSINCKCSSITVLVDRHNKPLFPAIIQRARALQEKWHGNSG